MGGKVEADVGNLEGDVGGGRRDDPLVNIGNLLTNMPDLPPGPMADAGLADLLSAPPGRRRTLKSRERW